MAALVAIEDHAKNPRFSVNKLAKIIGLISEQPRWRALSDRCADYYDGNQIEKEIFDELNARGQPYIIHNLTAPTIDSILGLEAKTRTGWQILADDESGIDVADALNEELHEAARLCFADRACSDAYAAMIKTGVGWVEINRESDPLKYKYRANYVHRNEIYWDFDSKNPDLSDCKWLVREKWVDVDQLYSVFPQHKKLLAAIASEWEDFDPNNFEELNVDFGDDLVSAFENETASAAEMKRSDWRDMTYGTNRLKVYEVYYRVYEQCFVLNMPNGKRVIFEEGNQFHIAAIQSGRVEVTAGSVSRLRLSYYVGPHRLTDEPSPHPHNKYPYVPFFGFREDRTGIPYGLIRRMLPAQDEINKRRSKITWVLNKLTIIKESDAVTGLNDDELRNELLQNDAVVNLNEKRAIKTRGIDVIWGSEISNQQFTIMQDAVKMINDCGGVFNSFMGKESNATSGVAIDSLVEQSTTTMGEVNDNYRFARQSVGELILANIVKDIGDKEHVTKSNVNNPSKATKIIKLNERIRDENGSERISNPLQQINTQVVLADVQSTPAYRQQVAGKMLESMRHLPEQIQVQMIDLVIEMLDLPSDKRNEMLKRARTATGNIDPETMTEQERQQYEEKAQIDKMLQEIEMGMKQVTLEKEKALVQEITTRTAVAGGEADKKPAEKQKIQAETVEINAKIQKIVSDVAEVRQRIASAAANEFRQPMSVM